MEKKSFDPTADNETIYVDQILPLVKQLRAICEANGIPFFASFQFGPDDLDLGTAANTPDGTPIGPIQAMAYLAHPTLHPLPIKERQTPDWRPIASLWNLCQAWWIKLLAAHGGEFGIDPVMRIIITLIELAAVIVRNGLPNFSEAQFVELARIVFGQSAETAAFLKRRNSAN